MEEAECRNRHAIRGKRYRKNFDLRSSAQTLNRQEAEQAIRPIKQSLEKVAYRYALFRVAIWNNTSAANSNIGANSGLQLIGSSLDKNRDAVQTINKTTAPASNEKIAHGSTAPNASGPSNNSANTP